MLMRYNLLYLLGFSFLILSYLTACDSQPHNIALGTLERDRIAHTATASEIIVALPISQGSRVKKGDVIVKLDDSLQKALVNKARAEVAQAEANLEKLRNGARVEEVAAARAEVASARAGLVESSANYLRIENLTKQKLTSKAELDKALAVRVFKQAGLKRVQEELLILTNGTRVEDLRIAEAILQAAMAVLASEEKRLKDLTIVATRNGLLDNLPWNLGERVTKGSPIAIVLAGNAPYVRVYIPEPYRVKVKVGDKLVVRVDGLNTALTGTLRWISNEPAYTPYYALNQKERARLVYLAEVQLPDSSSELPNGVPAQVELP